MSTFSPRSSLVTMRTRAPARADAGADGVDVRVVRPDGDLGAVPGLAGTAFISTTPLEISGTSSSKSRLMRPGWVRLTTIWGPLVVLRTSTM